MTYPDDLPKQDIANLEHKWVVSELAWCDLQVKLHQSSDVRAVKTIDDVYRYSRDLRGYTTIENEQAIIRTDKPEF